MVCYIVEQTEGLCSMSSKPKLQAVLFAEDKIPVCQGVTHDICVQETESLSILRLIGGQIKFYDSDRSGPEKFKDLPAGPQIFHEIFAECESAGNIEVTEYDGYEMHIGTATAEQGQRALAAL